VRRAEEGKEGAKKERLTLDELREVMDNFGVGHFLQTLHSKTPAHVRTQKKLKNNTNR
jgi:hypothetical protein